VGHLQQGVLKVEIINGQLKVLQEGRTKKFISDVEQITFNGSRAIKNKNKVTYITERAVFELRKEGLTLTEIAPGVDLEKDILRHMEFKPEISEKLKLMDEKIFKDELMGLIF